VNADVLSKTGKFPLSQGTGCELDT
jgi:hypothetical protein